MIEISDLNRTDLNRPTLPTFALRVKPWQRLYCAWSMFWFC